MVTIKEIAKYCGVSIATVSNIINGKPNVTIVRYQIVIQKLILIEVEEIIIRKMNALIRFIT